VARSFRFSRNAEARSRRCFPAKAQWPDALFPPTSWAILASVEASNREVLKGLNAGTQGVDVGPFIRAALTGDTSAMSPQIAADFAAYLGLLDPEVEIDTSGVDMPGFGVLHGLEGMRALWSRWIEGWEHYSWTQSNWSEMGEHVIADVQIRATGSSSGAEVTWNHCQLWTFREGKVIRWRFFNDRASALAAIENP
jgi:ketosteroid isomerase-like protein